MKAAAADWLDFGLAAGPRREPGLTNTQLGSAVEDQIAIAVTLSSLGQTTVGFPTSDLGFDLYPRRVRTLRLVPAQSKSRRVLRSDGVLAVQVDVDDIRNDPNGYVLFSHCPAPGYRVGRRVFAIPIPDLFAHCPRMKTDDGEAFAFEAMLDGSGPGPWSTRLVDMDQLDEQWLGQIPGWGDPSPLPPIPEKRYRRPLTLEPTARSVIGRYGELLAAAAIQFTGGMRVVVGTHRTRSDAVSLILHELATHRVAGIVVRTSIVEPGTRVEFQLLRKTLFLDERLFVLVLPCRPEGSLHEQCFVFPIAALADLTSGTDLGNTIAYHGNITLKPLTRTFEPYAVPSDQLGQAVLRLAFGWT